MSPTDLDTWLKKTTLDDTGLTRPPAVALVSTHKDEVRSIDHGYFQSQFRVPVYKEVGRPTHDSIKREQGLTKVTNVFMAQYSIPTDTNELSKLPSRNDVETWWMSNEQAINFRSEHGWTIDVEAASPQIFVGTHTAPSGTHDDDSGVLGSDEAYEQHYRFRDSMLDALRKSYLHGWTLKGAHACFVTYTQHAVKCKNATIPP